MLFWTDFEQTTLLDKPQVSTGFGRLTPIVLQVLVVRILSPFDPALCTFGNEQ